MVAPADRDTFVEQATDLSVPLRRFVLAWAVMVSGLVGFWCLRPWLSTSAFTRTGLTLQLICRGGTSEPGWAVVSFAISNVRRNGEHS